MKLCALFELTCYYIAVIGCKKHCISWIAVNLPSTSQQSRRVSGIRYTCMYCIISPLRISCQMICCCISLLRSIHIYYTIETAFYIHCSHQSHRCTQSSHPCLQPRLCQDHRTYTHSVCSAVGVYSLGYAI